MQKTELNANEAILAYGQGKRIQDKYGNEFWLEDSTPKMYAYLTGIVSSSPSWEYTPFTLVEPPHVNPTLEECLAAEEVQVTYPNGNGGRYTPKDFDSSLILVSYALDKGWKVEVVK